MASRASRSLRGVQERRAASAGYRYHPSMKTITNSLRLRERMARRRYRAICMQALDGRAQQELVNKLRADISSGEDASTGSAAWDSASQSLANHIRDDDPRRFLQWREIRSTMFVSDADYSSVELEALKAHDAWPERWAPALVEDPSGCPTPSRLDDTSSDNLIHHAYHILAAEERAGRIDDFDEIIEFGGGYGSFARLIRRLGITSKYHIHDLPAFTALQQYYLASVASRRGRPAIHENVTWGSSISELPAKTAAPRLFVALWSLSEMPEHDREPWCDVIAGCDGVIIGFQKEFEGTDNKSWFATLQQRVKLAWNGWEIPHLPGNFYLVGRRDPGSTHEDESSRIKLGAGAAKHVKQL